MAPNASLSGRTLGKTGTRYVVALSATMVGLLLRMAVNPYIGDYVPYITLFPVVAFCGWYCGVGPSILSVFVALVRARYWFIPPIHSLGFVGSAQAIGILAFLLFSGLMIAMG